MPAHLEILTVGALLAEWPAVGPDGLVQIPSTGRDYSPHHHVQSGSSTHRDL
jgi:hypothetical protein